MSTKDPKIFGFSQYQKSDKALFIIYADLECLIENIDECKNNLENSITTKVEDYIPWNFSIFTISSFRDCMKKFCESLIKHAMEIINFKKKKWSY